jgi:biopolymer transport protein ExbD
MRLRDQVRTIKPTVPTASMADIAFLLIIFFMLTTSFSPERTSVKLPESVMRTEVSKDAAIVAIAGNGTIMFTSGKEDAVALSGPDDLGKRIKELITQVPDKEFVIKADRDARYEWIDQVLDALRKNGARRIGLLTRPEPIPQQAAGG